MHLPKKPIFTVFFSFFLSKEMLNCSSCNTFHAKYPLQEIVLSRYAICWNRYVFARNKHSAKNEFQI